MALPITGSRLVAEDASKYVSDMNRGKKANEDFGESAKKGSIGATALSVGIGNILSAGVLKVADGLFQVGKAGVAAFAGSISGAADLEAQMSGVAAVLGGTQEELAQLKQLTVDLGIDPTLKVSSVEAAEAIEMLAKNGLSMTDIMDGAAKATVALSNATGGDFARSADIMTDAATIFGFKGNEMMNVVQGITAVTNASKFSVDDYALAIANGGSVAAQMGVEFADFNTTITAISPSFSSGMTAGTSFKNFLLRLTPASEQAKDAMAELGLVTDEGKSIFFDAQGGLRDMADIAGILQDALSGLSAEQQNQALRTIFGNDAMGAAIALAETGRERFLELGETMEQVDPNAAAAMRMDNFAGAMEILNGVIESVSLQVGAKFLPALTNLARVTGDFIANNADKFVAFFERGAELVDVFATELANGASPAEAFRAALANVTDPATLARWDEYVATGKDVVGELKNLATWASQNGPTIVNVLKGIGTGLLVFKTITTVAAGVTAFTAAWTAGGVAFTAAGGGLSGLVALLGGPVVVAAAAAAVAIGALVIVVSDLNGMYNEFETTIESQTSALRETSRATGDYTEEATKLVTAAETASSGLGILTFQADDMRREIEGLIAETGDFSGGLEGLEASLSGVFEGNVQVTDQFVLLDGKTIAVTDNVLKLVEANKQEAASAADRVMLATAVSQGLDEQTAAIVGTNQAWADGSDFAAMYGGEQARVWLGVSNTTMAIWDEQAALQAEVEAQAAAAEAAQHAAEIREEVAGVINSAVASQGGMIQTLIVATQELETAEMNLAAAPWNTDLIAKAETARDNVSAAFDAISESHRQMVLDIYVRNAELEGGFDKSAANIAVALGLMTQEEANLRLEAVHTTEEIGYLSDQMIQTFMEDGVISREEAANLAKAVADIEENSATANDVLGRLADDGLGAAEAGAMDAATAVFDLAGDMLGLKDTAEDSSAGVKEAFEKEDWKQVGGNLSYEIGDGLRTDTSPSKAAEESAGKVKEAYSSGDWGGVGGDISSGVASGITGGMGGVIDAAVGAVNAAMAAAQAAAGIQSPSTVAADEIGDPWSEGVAVGIVGGTPYIVEAVTDLFDDVGDVSSGGMVEWTDIVVGGIRGGLVPEVNETLASGLATWAGTLEDGLGELFDLAGPFASLGNTAVRRFQDSVLDPLLERSDQMEDRVGELRERIATELGREDFFTGGGTYGELLQLSRGELEGDSFRSIMAAKELLFLYEQQKETNEQIRIEQERIAALQQAQADLQFLEQQLKVIDLVAEHGLSTDLLEGLEVGINADPGAVIDAMTDVIRAIIEAAEAEAQIASPSKVFKGIGENITAGLSQGLGLGETAVSDEMRRLIGGMETAAIAPPATPRQTFSTAVNHQTDRSVNIQIENRSGGAPVNDADQLAFIWAGYNT